MLSFEQVHMDPAGWDSALATCPDYTVFQTAAWLSFVAKTQNAKPVTAVLKHNQETVGYFAGLIVAKYGTRILGSPFPGWTTSYMGFCLNEGFPRRPAIKALIRFAFEDLRCIHFELMDRHLKFVDIDGLDFGYRGFAGFEVNLRPSEDQIFANMSKSCRWTIRKAVKNGVTVEEATDYEFADDYYAQMQDVFSKQSLVPNYTAGRVRRLIEEVHPTGMLLLLRARDADGRCIATGLFPAANRTMYFWGGASWRQHQHLYPNELIQWYAMRYWKRRGICAYDMGGSGEYKRKYGGSEIFVPWFRHSKYRTVSYMRNVAQKAVKTRQIFLGKLKQLVSSGTTDAGQEIQN